ncbi:unnamed protein product, partial [Laminaria digitata]
VPPSSPVATQEAPRIPVRGVHAPVQPPSVLAFPLATGGNLLSSHPVARMKHCRCHHCKLTATFNIEGSKAAMYCKRHAEHGMVNVLGR